MVVFLYPTCGDLDSGMTFLEHLSEAIATIPINFQPLGVELVKIIPSISTLQNMRLYILLYSQNLRLLSLPLQHSFMRSLCLQSEYSAL